MFRISIFNLDVVFGTFNNRIICNCFRIFPSWMEHQSQNQSSDEISTRNAGKVLDRSKAASFLVTWIIISVKIKLLLNVSFSISIINLYQIILYQNGTVLIKSFPFYHDETFKQIFYVRKQKIRQSNQGDMWKSTWRGSFTGPAVPGSHFWKTFKNIFKYGLRDFVPNLRSL